MIEHLRQAILECSLNCATQLVNLSESAKGMTYVAMPIALSNMAKVLTYACFYQTGEAAMISQSQNTSLWCHINL
jgi:hypothetical protein